MGFNGRMERLEGRISDLEARTMERTQSEQQRENTPGKTMNQAPRTCGSGTALTKAKRPCSSSLRQRGESGWGCRVFKDIMAEKFQKLAKYVRLHTQEAG